MQTKRALSYKLDMMDHCAVCEARYRLEFKYRGFNYKRCTRCGLMSALPYPDEATIEEHYRKKFEAGNYRILRDAPSNYSQQSIYFRLLDSALSRPNGDYSGLKFLDIGCFTGDFLIEIKKRGGDPYGIELQAEAVDIANRRLDGRILKADVHGNVFPDTQFDVVSMIGVIEHVIDPLKLLLRALSLLKPGGVIVLQTVNSGSLFARIMRGYWPPYTPVEHIHHFTKDGLEQLLYSLSVHSVLSTSHVKRLRIEYVYSMLENFGPEFHRLFAPIYRFLPDRVRKTTLPFYAGEMIVTGVKA